ncbi:glucosaminidase domain-containing protein [Marinobacter sp. TBZ242]|uniref:Glucosaminidase domain-containing protein n=1 Tax=Marinobacter azerbaijanicus TaxID=3050455 RepID=A0ABT7IE66_9GAMM|nr:glucosaminidase domain-containing protein [Marinobacter sp. TBZ242]MDL0432027.1 glucosaminidase domain-containing protein [Marinobacter sp. TBZ242]
MSSGIRALMLIFPMVVFGFWGAVHTPEPDSNHNGDSDVALSELPPLPRWAREDLPDFSAYSDTTEKKAAFFSFLYPRIVLANSRILIEREYLQSLSDKDELTRSELTWLEKQAERLRVDEEPGSPDMFRRLENRLDVIPPSLVMAQAANESAWGTSRFARRGNNLFGQWCFSKGCGIVPQSRIEGASHEVADFESPFQSVRSYIQNLNRHSTYQPLRDIRLKARNNGELASGTSLAAGLLGYSERGEDYVEEIRSMIRYNNLNYYDDKFRSVQKNSQKALHKLAAASNEEALLPDGGADGADADEG